MKILLFGATGLFGTEFEDICAEQNVDFVGLSHSDVDVTDHQAVEDLIRKHAPDVVINAVAIVGIDPCEDNPGPAYAINAAAPAAMARYCGENNITFVQTSTHAVFDGEKTTPYTEDDTPNPISVYSLSKFAGECFARELCDKHYVVRLTTMFGRRRNAAPGFVDKMVERFQNGVDIRVAEDKYDSPSYARDSATALLNLLTSGQPWGTYHIANKGNVNYYEFILELKSLLSAENDVQAAKDSDFPGKGHKPLRTAIASNKLQPVSGWQDALKRYVDRELL